VIEKKVEEATFEELKDQLIVMGFDVRVNGPDPAEGDHRSQIMMFGTAGNCSDASRFGVGMLDEATAP
jgi:hypothetical protein